MDRLNPLYIDAVRYLYDRINYEKSSDRPYDQRAYRLARMQHFLGELNNPHLAAPVIHIAGTKGKGSVSWLLAEAFRRAGLSVGLYTSPHLVHLEERFVVDGRPCSPEELTWLVDSLRRAEEATSRSTHGSPTFFEMTTAMAWMLFANRKTQVNVIEVGLGGRLDSTNVCQSQLAVITSISLDHQQQLGNTIAQIAGEKAGIIKPNVPVVSGARHPEAQRVIREKCEETQSPLWQLGVDYDADTISPALPSDHLPSRLFRGADETGRMEFVNLSSRQPIQSIGKMPMRMMGDHQADNAAVAIAAWQRLAVDGWALPMFCIRDSMSATQVPCRIEVVADKPTVVLDTAHNEASMQALLQTLAEYFRPTKTTIIFACSKDKNYDAMIRQVLAYTDRLIVTQFQNNPRSVPVERLEELAKAQLPADRQVEVLSSPSSALAMEYAMATATDSDLICIAGSFFLASEMRPLFPETYASQD
jgi:dihydrofolate synthase/folylpolyglutamate synthase